MRTCHHSSILLNDKVREGECPCPLYYIPRKISYHTQSTQRQPHHPRPTNLFPPLSSNVLALQRPHPPIRSLKPSTGELITTVQAGNSSTIDAEIQGSQTVFDNGQHWRSPGEWCVLIQKIADKLDENKEKLARLPCKENGKPYLDALAFDLTFLVKVF